MAKKSRILIADMEVGELAKKSGFSGSEILKVSQDAMIAVNEAGFPTPRTLQIMLGVPGLSCSYKATGLNTVAVHLDPTQIFDADCPIDVLIDRLSYTMPHEISHPAAPTQIMEMFYHTVLRRPFGFHNTVDGLNHAVKNTVKDVEIDSKLITHNMENTSIQRGLFSVHDVESFRDAEDLRKYKFMKVGKKWKLISEDPFGFTRLMLRVVRRATVATYFKHGLGIRGKLRQKCTDYGGQFHLYLKGMLPPDLQSRSHEIYQELIAICYDDQYDMKRFTRMSNSFRVALAQ